MVINLQFLRNDAGEEEGLGDAGIELFKDAPYASCAREAGQNSRDAAADTPVTMRFDVIEISHADLPLHAELVAAVSACRKEATQEKDIDFFNEALKLLNAPAVKVLHISDYNTKGLIGPPEQTGTPFHSLLKASGVSNKESDTSGGSFGIGKNASFAVTDLQTVLYSTRYLDETSGAAKFAAQGKVKLVSHQDSAGVARRATGYWGNSNGFLAITDQDQVPSWMRRSEVGTSIFCVGFRESPDWAHRIGYSLITNFFTAIHRDEMAFQVNGTLKLNRNTVGALFSNTHIRGAAEEASHLSDLEFSQQLYHCLTSPATVVTDLNIAGLGIVRIHILLEEGLPKKVGIVRNGMLITTSLEHFGSKLERFPGSREFIALVEPISSDAGKMLKTLENPAHNGFSAHRISEPGKRAGAERAMKQLAKELRDAIREATAISHDDEVTLDDLSRYFAEEGSGDRPPDPKAQDDPEKHIYKPPPPTRTRRRAAGAKGTQGGRGLGGGGGGNQPGVGSESGSGLGGKGQGGRNRAVPLHDLRNLVNPDARFSRKIYFTPAESGRIAFGLEATGVNGAERLNIVSSNTGTPKDGVVWLDVFENERVVLEVEFDDPYFGPVEAVAVATDVKASV